MLFENQEFWLWVKSYAHIDLKTKSVNYQAGSLFTKIFILFYSIPDIQISENQECLLFKLESN